MRHPLNCLLRIGRSPADRQALLGDLAEEHRRRTAGGGGRLTAFGWYTREIVAAFGRAMFDMRPAVRGAIVGDARYALRRWRHRPGFAATAIVTLALGIASATAVFSVVDAVLLKPLPWRDPDSLVMIHGVYPGRRANPATAPTWNRWYLSYPAWDALRQSPAFAMVGAWRYIPFADTTIGDDRTEIVTPLEVSSSFLPMLGVSIAAGRYFNDIEDNVSTDSVILTHETWQRRFGGRADVIGARLMLGSASSREGYPKTIVGVTQPGFRFEGIVPDLFIPIGIPANTFRRYPSPALRVVARLAPGVSLATAHAQAESLASAAPSDLPGSARVVPLEEDHLGSSRRPLWLLFGAAGILLIVACSNVAGLLLGEARVRRHEIGVRTALGGSRRQVLRQLVVEHALLAGAGGVLGLTVAYWLIGVLTALAPPGMPRIDAATLDWRATVFAMAAGLGTFASFGIAPAVSLARLPVAGVLAEGGRDGGISRVMAQRFIVSAQIALALVLLTGAALFGETMLRLNAQPLGFDPSGVAVISTTFTGNHYGDPAKERAAWKSPGTGEILLALRTSTTEARTRAVLERLSALPGLTHAAAASAVPFVNNPTRLPIVLEGRPDTESYEVLRQSVTEGYFATMRIPFLRGRGFDASDAGETSAVVVSSEFERRLFNGDAVGRRFKYVYGDRDERAIPYLVVGVVPDVKRQDPTDDDRPTFYASARLDTATPNHFLIRTAGDPEPLLAAARHALTAVSPNLVVTSMAAMTSRVRQAVVEERFRATLSSAFGAAALTLAAIGLYGVATRRVADRRREFGVRVALGARPADVRRLVFRDAVVIVSVGLAIGLPASIAAAQIARSLLFGVSASSPHVFVIAAVVLGASGAAAAILPARRASRIDPVRALRA